MPGKNHGYGGQGMKGGKKMSSKSKRYDGAVKDSGLRVASKVNKRGIKRAPEKGGKDSGGTKLW
tara:strand:+ start:32 stop:223 length:192 start_codon:yes stop_codon:yes gene_type:complete